MCAYAHKINVATKFELEQSFETFNLSREQYMYIEKYRQYRNPNVAL